MLDSTGTQRSHGSAREARFLRWVALGGAIGVAAFVFARGEGTAVRALATACAVIVPLGLALGMDDAKDTPRIIRRGVVVFAPISVVAMTLSWRLPIGHSLSVGAASLHAITCALAGVLGLYRLWSRRAARFAPLDAFAIDVGLVLVPVGGVWLLASRAGSPLAGFQEPVVTFTAAHFHFAGLAAPAIIGGAGRLVAPAQSMLRRYATLVVCAGVPLTAIGIATNHTVEQVAAVVLASGMLGASVLLIGFASRRAWKASQPAAILLVVSGASLLLTMALAATFAMTSSAGRGSSLSGAIPLQTMIDLHGGGNAFGFATCGLVALSLLSPIRAIRPSGDDGR